MRTIDGIMIKLKERIKNLRHAAFDRFELGNRAESEAMFEKWLVKTELMMNQTDKEVF